MTVVAFLMPVYDTIGFLAADSLVSICCAWPTVAPRGWRLKLGIGRGQPVTEVRNNLTHRALSDQGSHDLVVACGAPADVLLWNDSDCSLPKPEDYVRLVRQLLAMPDDVAALGVPLPCQEIDGRPRHNMSLHGIEGGEERFHEDMSAGACPEVAGVGFGVIACRATAYRAIGYPWHEFLPGPEPATPPRGEDMYWCDKVRLAGWRIYVHPTIKGFHNFRRALTLDTRDARTWAAFQPPHEETTP